MSEAVVSTIQKPVAYNVRRLYWRTSRLLNTLNQIPDLPPKDALIALHLAVSNQVLRSIYEDYKKFIAEGEGSAEKVLKLETSGEKAVDAAMAFIAEAEKHLKKARH